ncbi:MAG: MarR family transcriptional regulator [Desulfovibrionaceae bacterium]|nr:MarR family transcriptional regulator [Desulfovibrionaceae bacterium]
MADSDFKSKVAFIVEADGLLTHYLESTVIKKIKSGMPGDSFRNLTSNHIHAALLLKDIAPCALKSFAEAMQLSRAAASGLVDRMVRAGLVRREANPDNRREVVLTVSPEFEQDVAHVRAEMGLWFEALATRMGMESFEKWHDAMRALHAVLKEEIQPGGGRS